MIASTPAGCMPCNTCASAALSLASSAAITIVRTQARSRVDKFAGNPASARWVAIVLVSRSFAACRCARDQTMP